MFKRILVPLDGSRLAEAALPAALELASKFDSQVTLLRVVQPPQLMLTYTDGTVYTELLASLRQEANEEAGVYLKALRNSLRQQGFRVQAHTSEGDPVAAVILEVVTELECDTIVMSTHGRGGVSRWVFGSVADKVLRQARVPLLLIRASEETVA